MHCNVYLFVLGTVVVIFVVCWSLTAFRTIVMQYKLMEVSWNVTNISRLLLVANSAINPVIYALWKNDINKEINKLFRRFAACKVTACSVHIWGWWNEKKSKVLIPNVKNIDINLAIPVDCSQNFEDWGRSVKTIFISCEEPHAHSMPLKNRCYTSNMHQNRAHLNFS